jgi:hypothetical protein
MPDSRGGQHYGLLGSIWARNRSRIAEKLVRSSDRQRSAHSLMGHGESEASTEGKGRPARRVVRAAQAAGTNQLALSGVRTDAAYMISVT